MQRFGSLRLVEVFFFPGLFERLISLGKEFFFLAGKRHMRRHVSNRTVEPDRVVAHEWQTPARCFCSAFWAIFFRSNSSNDMSLSVWCRCTRLQKPFDVFDDRPFGLIEVPIGLVIRPFMFQQPEKTSRLPHCRSSNQFGTSSR
jgi:hypothetical protein